MRLTAEKSLGISFNFYSSKAKSKLTGKALICLNSESKGSMFYYLEGPTGNYMTETLKPGSCQKWGPMYLYDYQKARYEVTCTDGGSKTGYTAGGSIVFKCPGAEIIK